MNGPPPPPPPPPAPPKPRPKFEIVKLGFNALDLKVNSTLTRADVFRLIGELERIGSSI